MLSPCPDQSLTVAGLLAVAVVGCGGIVCGNCRWWSLRSRGNISSKPAAVVLDKLLTYVRGKASLLFYALRLQRSARPASSNLTGICANTVCFAPRFFRRAAVVRDCKRICHRHEAAQVSSAKLGFRAHVWRCCGDAIMRLRQMEISDACGFQTVRVSFGYERAY